MDDEASRYVWCIERNIQYLSREFILETDAFLNDLGAILSQQGKDGKIHVIA